ncbi:Hsp20/alpha crystallin family protein [Chryseobacterium joostei]|uniref:HSP20 family protein n=1 Tax=Chryseobacterium joostei TaxID=112234 RepID=A0A1N7HSP2_9FLAO|nr:MULTISPECIES: Hsp20/alpha crystallin family protein [Chryseobacterium]AZA77095.1 Hsp20/alpha crystallin family protein [Chryseobacterium sp. G0186]AZA99281.1 Hsp20/alpha crystallin family protein [Chryseobacterium joostei]SIS27730.1 HSP20 family protein [Chryseobacterium joostei]
MKTLEKTTQSPMARVIEDFWNKDGFLDESMKMEPTINIIDRNGVYKVRVSAPGFKKKDFKVAAEDGSLIISAEKRIEKKEEKENFVRKEFSASSFSRSFRLPENITLGHIKANYKNGLLNITISKTNLDKREVKEIKIR